MNEMYTIGSVTKPFLVWCVEAGASPYQVRAHVSRGVPLERALQLKDIIRIPLFAMNGYTKSLTQWCKEYGVSRDMVKKRLQEGYTLQEALEAPPYSTHKNKKLGCQAYALSKRFLAWCEEYLADPLYVRAAMSTGTSLQHALTRAKPGSEPFLCLDGHLDTFTNLCSHFNLVPNTVRKRIHRGLTLQDAFYQGQYHKGDIGTFIKMGRANESHTISAPLAYWCDRYHIAPKAVLENLTHGLPLEQALVFQHYSPHPYSRRAVYQLNGKSRTLTQWAQEYGVNVCTLISRLQRGIPLEDALTIPKYTRTGTKQISGHKATQL